MKNFARIQQLSWALGVLLLFTVSALPAHAVVVQKKQDQKKKIATTDVKNLSKKQGNEFIQKKKKEHENEKNDINDIVRNAIMEPDSKKAFDEYYTFSDDLLDRLDALDVTLEEFRALIENINRSTEPPKRVDIIKPPYNNEILKKYDRNINKNTVGVFYAARYSSGPGGSQYDMLFLTKTDDGWKIDPSFSFWFVRKACISPIEWKRTDRGGKYTGANESCDNSKKTFKAIHAKNDKAIGAKVRTWAEPFLTLRQPIIDTEKPDDTSKTSVNDDVPVEPGG